MSLVSLGEVAKFINGVAFKPEDWGPEGLPIIRIQNLTGTSSTFNYTTREINPDLYVYEGDLLVSWSATLDVFVWRGPKGVLNQHIFKVLPKNNVDSNYLYYALKSCINSLLDKTHGSTMKHVVRGDFESAKIYLPSISEQKNILKELTRSEELIKLNTVAIEKLHQLIDAYFFDIFGDTISNDRKWPIEKFGDIVVNLDGKRKPIKSADRGKRRGVFPYYGASGIIDYIDDFIFDGTYLLIAEDGANLISRSTPLAFQASGRFWVNNHAHIVMPTDKVDLIYLEYFLNNRGFDDAITGSAQPKLNQANMNRIDVPVPPINLQKEFSGQATKILSITSKQKESLAKTEEMFSSLLNNYFSHHPLTVGA